MGACPSQRTSSQTYPDSNICSRSLWFSCGTEYGSCRRPFSFFWWERDVDIREVWIAQSSQIVKSQLWGHEMLISVCKHSQGAPLKWLLWYMQSAKRFPHPAHTGEEQKHLNEHPRQFHASLDYYLVLKSIFFCFMQIMEMLHFHANKISASKIQKCHFFLTHKVNIEH